MHLLTVTIRAGHRSWARIVLVVEVERTRGIRLLANCAPITREVFVVGFSDRSKDRVWIHGMFGRRTPLG
jgi:hypothetical protein